MRPLAILREGLKSAGARFGQYVLITLMLGCLLAAIGSAEVITTAAAVSKMEHEVDKGATVLVIDRNDGDLGGSQCLRLGRVQGVVAVGAVSNVEITGFAGYPSIPFQRASLTPGMVDILYPGLRLRSDATGLAGEGVGEEVGLVDGSTVTLNDKTEVTLSVPRQGTARSEDRAR